MQLIKADSLVITDTGDFGRVESIAIIYKEGEPPKTAVRVYLLLQGRSEDFSASQLRLRSNDESQIIQHMRMEPDERFIEPEGVF